MAFGGNLMVEDLFRSQRENAERARQRRELLAAPPPASGGGMMTEQQWRIYFHVRRCFLEHPRVRLRTEVGGPGNRGVVVHATVGDRFEEPVQAHLLMGRAESEDFERAMDACVILMEMLEAVATRRARERLPRGFRAAAVLA